MVRDEEEPHDLRAPLVEARVSLHVKLFAAAYDWPVVGVGVTARLVVDVAEAEAYTAIGVDLVDHWARGRALGFHCWVDGIVGIRVRVRVFPGIVLCFFFFGYSLSLSRLSVAIVFLFFLYSSWRRDVEDALARATFLSVDE